MKAIVLFDPSIRSLNMGDHIIMNSAEEELKKLMGNNYIIKCGTHTPAVTFYQNTSANPRMKVYDEAKYKFICGSNLLWKNLFLPRPTFNVNLWNCRVYRNSILVGVGTNAPKKKINLYTKTLYTKILSKNFIHSVRDEETKRFVESMGYKAINTGCPTMWKFTAEFCKSIPIQKSDDVVFTLTDYNRDLENDQELINILNRNYKNVYFWIQGMFDLEYLNELKDTKNIKLIPPTLEAFSEILNRENIEYVGTRLHAGMFAMQHKKRSIILAIDNRVRDMKETYNLNTVERDDIKLLENMINDEFETKISINEEKIQEWFSQFEKD